VRCFKRSEGGAPNGKSLQDLSFVVIVFMQIIERNGPLTCAQDAVADPVNSL